MDLRFLHVFSRGCCSAKGKDVTTSRPGTTGHLLVHARHTMRPLLAQVCDQFWLLINERKINCTSKLHLRRRRYFSKQNLLPFPDPSRTRASSSSLKSQPKSPKDIMAPPYMQIVHFAIFVVVLGRDGDSGFVEPVA